MRRARGVGAFLLFLLLFARGFLLDFFEAALLRFLLLAGFLLFFFLACLFLFFLFLLLTLS